MLPKLLREAVCAVCFVGVYSVGSASPKQLLSCAEMAGHRHKEVLEQLKQAADKMES